MGHWVMNYMAREPKPIARRLLLEDLVRWRTDHPECVHDLLSVLREAGYV